MQKSRPGMEKASRDGFQNTVVPALKGSEQGDLNPRPTAPKAAALAELRYAPIYCSLSFESVWHLRKSLAIRRSKTVPYYNMGTFLIDRIPRLALKREIRFKGQRTVHNKVCQERGVLGYRKESLLLVRLKKPCNESPLYEIR